MKRATISVTCSEEFREFFHEYARRKGLSMAAQALTIIKSYCENHPKTGLDCPERAI